MDLESGHRSPVDLPRHLNSIRAGQFLGQQIGRGPVTFHDGFRKLEGEIGRQFGLVMDETAELVVGNLQGTNRGQGHHAGRGHAGVKQVDLPEILPGRKAIKHPGFAVDQAIDFHFARNHHVEIPLQLPLLNQNRTRFIIGFPEKKIEKLDEGFVESTE